MLKINLTPSWSIGRDVVETVPVEIIALLEFVVTLGSLQQSAKAANLSYRHAWGLMQHWEQVTGHKLLLLERGRGATLSPFGERLLQLIKRSNDELGPALENFAVVATRELDLAGNATLPRLRILASHDLALLKLRESLPANESAALDLKFQGSLDNVIALSKGKCDLAGFHLMASVDTDNFEPFDTHLKPRLHALIHFVNRVQGLMVAKGNPRRIRGLTDFLKPNLRFINRQPGSGTRLLFDSLLGKAGLSGHDIEGYQNEEFTHLAVAATVASNMADVGFGLAAAAKRNDLQFIPLVTERYLFACRRDQLNHPTITRLRSQMQSAAFQKSVRELDGYDALGAGEVVALG
ncbi:MAG: substrate-binding domain-containing protein [Betaproteobacteria bacterium]